jgi:hypothetical protein
MVRLILLLAPAAAISSGLVVATVGEWVFRQLVRNYDGHN